MVLYFFQKWKGPRPSGLLIYFYAKLKCDCFISLAFRIDFVEVISDVTCCWGPTQATESRLLQRHRISISVRPSYWTIISFGWIGLLAVFLLNMSCSFGTWPSEWIAMLCISQHKFACFSSSHSPAFQIWIVNEAFMAQKMNAYCRRFLMKLCAVSFRGRKDW